jgi:uncharacterized protein (TIGR02452 family)
MADRNERIKIAAETVEISKKGTYTSYQGKNVSFDATLDTEFWDAKDLEKLSTEGAVAAGRNVGGNPAASRPSITCVDEDVVATVLRLAEEGMDMSRVGVLNFASARHAGGGFLNGAMAQEEAIAYCSNLYVNQIVTPYYDQNAKVRSAMYTDHMIWSGITFFRDSKYRFLEKPVKTNVLTSPAVNMGQVRIKGENEAIAKRVMKHRMGLVLDLFAEKGCKTIVLGAFGCGVFQNDPDDVAKNWIDLIEEKGHHFDQIIMTVLDKPGFSNYKVFKKYF